MRLRIHTHVREDALALYGFLTQDEKALFEKLISVSGIGPTLAVKILSGLAAGDLTLAIRRGEVEKLVKVPGVGKKTAERMVETARQLPWGEESGAPVAEALSLIEQDVLSALLNLGCPRPKPPCARPRPLVPPSSLNRSSGALWNWYGKLVAHARPGTGFGESPG